MSEATPDDVITAAPARASILPMMYAGAIIVAALYFGHDLLVPMVLAALLAFVLAPACALFERLRLPRVAAVLIVVLLAFAAIGGIGLVVGRQATALTENLPAYRTTIMEKWTALSDRFGVLARYAPQAAKPASPAPAGQAASAPDVQATAAKLGFEDMSGLSLARMLAQPLLGPLATGGIVLVFTIFMLMASEDLRDRLVRLVGRQDLHRTILAMNDAAGRLSRYFLFQLALNTSFGVVIGLCLFFAGMPNALLWGILAALMRFVPYVGVFIAVLPPLLLSVAVVPGWSLALIVLALFIVAEIVMGQVVEPLLYGHSTGLSPLAVVVATAFWALIWGPVGLLIATPLTVCLVVIGRHVEALAFLDVILGDKPPLTPPETFYQRALEGQAMALVPGARKEIQAGSATDYFDKVALPGLALAQADLARDALAFERLESIHGQIDAVLMQLADKPSPTRTAVAARSPPPARWQADGAVVCIAGRGQLDDLTAAMAVQSLRQDGFGADVTPNLVLGSSVAVPAALDRTILCCLSMLESGSTAAGALYFIRRIQKQMPNAAIVVGLWHAGRDSALLAALRAEGGDVHIVLSIGELLAFCRALCARSPAAIVPARLTDQATM